MEPITTVILMGTLLTGSHFGVKKLVKDASDAINSACVNMLIDKADDDDPLALLLKSMKNSD